MALYREPFGPVTADVSPAGFVNPYADLMISRLSVVEKPKAVASRELNELTSQANRSSSLQFQLKSPHVLPVFCCSKYHTFQLGDAS